MAVVPSSSRGSGGTVSGVTVTGTASAGMVPVASSSSAGAWAWATGLVIAYGTKTSNVTTTGGTFAAGADILAAALSFTADGTSDYGLLVWAPGWQINIAGTSAALRINLDGADAGFMGYNTAGSSVPMALAALGIILAPAAGAHTANARITSDTTHTVTVNAGAGGAGANCPAVVAVIRL